MHIKRLILYFPVLHVIY
ncbi:hypothetical protein Patl1_20356 [Pistacia atlantica]|uniref:Uncharacterized protein n=1 Tax=Pistacia atlantica TaxID=434234 RepID=A0ACC1BKS2_9ROSI|nr:hypothetical protein Patl1_20356 [Pistacia atlantica]